MIPTELSGRPCQGDFAPFSEYVFCLTKPLLPITFSAIMFLVIMFLPVIHVTAGRHESLAAVQKAVPCSHAGQCELLEKEPQFLVHTNSPRQCRRLGPTRASSAFPRLLRLMRRERTVRRQAHLAWAGGSVAPAVRIGGPKAAHAARDGTGSSLPPRAPRPCHPPRLAPAASGLPRAASGSRRGAPRRTMSLPKVLVFDLDGTLWAPEMYELWGGGAPFEAKDGGRSVTDRAGREVRLLRDTREILEGLLANEAVASGETTLGIASTCDEPAWARECLEKIMLQTPSGESVRMGSVFRHNEIYKARSKKEHFIAIHRASGADFEDMAFFDNQMNNIRAVKELGVHCVYTPEGQTHAHFNQGVEAWRKGKGKSG